ncbi:MAG: hypothetical protein R2693_13415 [Nocardioidaceae bacterium]|jgi:hypothetical protein
MTISEQPSEAAELPPRMRLKGSLADRLEILLPLLGYVVVVLAKLSTSSLGIASLRGANPQGWTLGEPLAIRSDEWLTETPLELGVLSHGSPVFSPLAHGPNLIYQLPSGGVFESLLFVEGDLLRLGPWLPDAVLFSAVRALPLLVLLLTLPPLMRRLGATRSLSWLAVVLTVCTPAALWWSFWPVRILAFAAAGSYLLVLARDRFERKSWPLGVFWAVIAGGCIARLATFYVPWGITIGVPLAAATTAYLLSDKQRWRLGLRSLLIGASSSIVLLLGTFFDNRAALKSELSTVYPGLRRSGGAAQSPMELFGAPGLANMRWLADPIVNNRSEITSAFTIAVVWALVLWAHRRDDIPTPQLWATRTLAGFTGLWLSWIVIEWGGLGQHIPILSLIPAPRVGQTIGFIGVLLVCLLLAQLPKVPSGKVVWSAAVACTALTAYGVSDLQERALPDLATWVIWVSAALTGVAVAILTRWHTRLWPVVAVSIVLVVFAATVNPVISGLGDLRGTKAARTAERIAKESRAEKAFVVSDLSTVNALLVANGAPTLTGYQVTGPVRDQWRKLDPEGKFEHEWNRGASYIEMEFVDAPEGPAQISNPTNDRILVTADPCWVDTVVPISYVFSTKELQNSCLVPVGHMRWSQTKVKIYQMVGATSRQ